MTKRKSGLNDTKRLQQTFKKTFPQIHSR